MIKLKRRFSNYVKGLTVRDSRLLLSVLTSILAKFIAIGSTLITIPVTLNYLGAESFGIWMVISGVVAFISFSDFGIGMGLQNALSKAYGEDDYDSPKHYIANACLILTGVACFLATLVFFLFSVLPMERVFKVEDAQLVNSAVSALKYTLFAFVFGIPISLIQRILSGVQKTYIANNVMLVGSILSLLSILIAVYFDLGLVGLSIFFTLSPSAALLSYGVYFFYKNSHLKPRFSNLSKAHVSPIVSAGAWTVFVQIIYTAKMNVPTLIISASLGLLAVAEYSIAQKLTGLAASVIGIALQPLWVVYGEAYHRGDKVWVENALIKSIKMVFLLTVCSAIIFQFLGQPVIELWLGGEVLPSKLLIACFSLWMISSTVNISFSMLLNGTGFFKNQSLFSFVFIGLSLLLIFYYVDDVGVAGVVFILFLVAELACVPMYYLESKRVLSELSCENK